MGTAARPFLNILVPKPGRKDLWRKRRLARRARIPRAPLQGSNDLRVVAEAAAAVLAAAADPGRRCCVSWREPSRVPQTHAPTVPLRHGTHFLAFLSRMPDGRGRVSHWRAGGAVVVALPSPMDDEEEQEAVAGPHLPRAFGAIAVFARVVIYAPSLDGGGCSGGGTVSGRLDAVPADVLCSFSAALSEGATAR
ncbi:hypothetical protein HPB51_020752 [Rhipicephalus microplus]|uniref:Uncharacterized protein n=1 Tax=Rhipicephalus microplus TaxID=6941 RepID=A0A9J6DQ33_RHIMP|nr:hypothetical protein HPB51_020752 [Rhipicephalus microplus]